VILSTLGASAVTLAGYLGGHLAYRKGIGVDQTAFQPETERWKRVMSESDLEEGSPRRVSVDGVDILLVRTGDGIRALADRCSHRGGPLHEGEIKDGTVVCPWHQSAFALDDGRVVHGPATAPQPVYDVRTSDGQIEVRSADR
jgi:nitrite reductase/ring-hydroxylating ferredoxin subunit